LNVTGTDGKRLFGLTWRGAAIYEQKRDF